MQVPRICIPRDMGSATYPGYFKVHSKECSCQPHILFDLHDKVRSESKPVSTECLRCRFLSHCFRATSLTCRPEGGIFACFRTLVQISTSDSMKSILHFVSNTEVDPMVSNKTVIQLPASMSREDRERLRLEIWTAPPISAPAVSVSFCSGDPVEQTVLIDISLHQFFLIAIG